MSVPGAIALIAMPWPLYERPSIQLGALKAYVNRRAPDLQVEIFHHYVAVGACLGIELYQQIAAGGLETEFAYAALLYPERREALADGWRRRHPAGKKISLPEIASRLAQAYKDLLERVDWQRFALVGFSHCTWQLTASIYALRQLKSRYPDLLVVLGGSGCGGEMGASLLQTFPEIDYIVRGEGEAALLELAQALISGSAPRQFHNPNILCSGQPESAADGAPTRLAENQIADLDSLPLPDYRPYFQEIAEHLGPAPFLATLPVEGSRGCWWQSATGQGCKFCNLNLQWQGYRSKSPGRLIHEIDALSSTYGCLDFALMDNVLPRRGVPEFCQGLAHLHQDLRIFVELRAGLPADQWLQLSRAGVRQVQIGIEALSASLLKKMGKGTTVMDNVWALKCCAEAGIAVHANLIYDFPGASAEEISETLQVLPFLISYPPLTPVRFFLGIGSPLYRQAAAARLTLTGNHADYNIIWPKSQFPHLKLVKQGYRVKSKALRPSWRPVLRALKAGERHYQAVASAYPGKAQLSWREGGDFILIKRLKPRPPHENFRLKGRSREIYLFCQRPRALNKIQRQFPSFSQERLLTFLNGLVNQRLMFRTGSIYLSLALREEHYAAMDG